MSVEHMKLMLAVALSGVLTAAASGQTTRPAATGADPNPPAEGFDLEGSDPEAIAIADRVMEKLGGRAAWDGTRHLVWNWFAREFYAWDKHTGAVRIEAEEPRTGEPILVLVNTNDTTGRAWRGAEEITDPDELAGMLERGKRRWINAAYWMFMPYKLKDSGVTLRSLGEGTTVDGAAADVLELTFEEVGVTPGNKYHVYVGRESGLVEQWDYFSNAEDPAPAFKGAWRNWQSLGPILISDDRGEQGVHTDIGVYDELPDAVYTRAVPTGLPNSARDRRARFAAAMERLTQLLGDWRCNLMEVQPDGTAKEIGLRWSVGWAFNETYLRVEMHSPTSLRPGFANAEQNRIMYMTYDPVAEEYQVTRLIPALSHDEIVQGQTMLPVNERGVFNRDGILELFSVSAATDGGAARHKTTVQIYDERRFVMTDFRYNPARGDWRPFHSYLVTKPRPRPAPESE